MDYSDILAHIEHMIEGIEFDELNLLEIKTKLEELASSVEDSIGTFGRDNDEFDFSDLM
jgi:hypothetical protein